MDRTALGWPGDPRGLGLLEDFAPTVAHELRTPLAIVQLAAATVLERSDELHPDLCCLVGSNWPVKWAVDNVHLERELVTGDHV